MQNPHLASALRQAASGPPTILWLLGPGDNANRISYIRGFFQKHDPAALPRLRFAAVNQPTPVRQFFRLKPKTKEKRELAPNYAEILRSAVGAELQSASVVVINDFSVLAAVLAATKSDPGNKQTLSTWRGSVYTVPALFRSPARPDGIPAIVVDDISKCYVSFESASIGAATALGKTDRTSRAVADEIARLDLAKVHRFWLSRTRPTPTFRYDLVVAPQANDLLKPDLTSTCYSTAEFETWLATQTVLALDYETANLYTSCLGIAGIPSVSAEGFAALRCWTLPFMAPNSSPEMQGQAIHALAYQRLCKLITDSPAIKIYANGSYDAHYHLKERATPTNPGSGGLPHDVIHLWHAQRPMLPKSLAAIASYTLDNYTYWKDDIKGDATERAEQTSDLALPITDKSLAVYWRYCALDCYYTLLSFFQMLANGVPDYAIANYARELSLQYGPLLLANFAGMPLDTAHLARITGTASGAAASALDDLHIASDGLVTTGKDSELATWLYGTLAPTLPASFKNKPSMNAKQLLLIAEQHPIFASALRLIQAYKYPRKTDTSYSNLRYPTFAEPAGARFQYSYAIAGTYTGRLSGRGSSFWYGSNPQNIPSEVRSSMRAEPGHFLIDIDYSQADLYHFAVACNDQAMMANVFDDRDTHAVHVETILRVPYAKTIAGKRANDPSVVHPVTGTRQIIKKLSHGANYGMTSPSVYLNAGKEALNYAAVQLGQDPGGWSMASYYALIDQLLAPYFAGYPRQMLFREEVVEQCIRQRGLMTCMGGLTTYFHEWQMPRERKSLMRKLLAFFGQGGTAGMINLAIHRMYYGQPASERAPALPPLLSPADNARYPGLRIALQTHDSITYQAPLELLTEPDLFRDILQYMETPCIFNNVEYAVPCEMQVGFSWDKKIPVLANNATTPRAVLTVLGDFLNPSYEKKKA